jgi:hypothetical protein
VHQRQLVMLTSCAGLFQLANVLRENTLGSIAISVLFAVAALTHWQAGQHLPAVLAQRISEAATAAVYFIAGDNGICWAYSHRMLFKQPWLGLLCGSSAPS